jgi:ABC-2 type transport system permease protein
MRAFYALFAARNKEFLRDRGTMAWNFLFPFVAVFAIALVFSGNSRELYKVGVVGLPMADAAPSAAGQDAARQPAGPAAAALTADARHDGAAPGDSNAGAQLAAAGDGAAPGGPDGRTRDPQAAVQAFLHTRYVHFIPVDDLDAAEDKVRHHLYDLVLDARGPPRYWVNPTNPKGYFLERVLWSTGSSGGFQRQELAGREIRYIDWLLPGILAMNMMFSCLWGVGYVIVRYRKGLILRRLKASPITAMQFICAQIASRLVLVMFVTVVIFFGLDLVLHFYNAGSLLALFAVFALGGVCNIALGILMASRTSNEELAGGFLNLATWPMMFLSGIWFSLEGSAPWLIALSRIFPLTHLIDAARKIMVDGATLAGVVPELTWLTAMTAAFLVLGALLFRWE